MYIHKRNIITGADCGDSLGVRLFKPHLLAKTGLSFDESGFLSRSPSTLIQIRHS